MKSEQSLSVQQSTPSRLPLTAIAAALVALGALWLSSGNWLLIVPMLLLVGSTLSPMRFDGDGNLVRLGRYALFGLILWQAYERATSDTGSDTLEMIFAYTTGYLCAIEMTIQAWLRRPASGARSPAMILLSAMVFLAASNTFDQRFIRYLTPLYFLFLSLSWRAYQPSVFTSRTFWRRGLMLATVLGLSALVHGGVWHYRNEISQWGMKFLEGRSAQATGLSTDPHLGSRFNLRGTLTRMLHIVNLPPDQDHLYLRAAAFADYEDNRWLPSINQQPGSTVSLESLRSRERASFVQPLLRVTRLTDDQNLVFAPLHTAGFTFPHDTEAQWKPPLGPLQAGPESSSGNLVYEVSLSQQKEFQGLFCQPPGKAWLARYRKVPEAIDPRVKVLAHSIGARAKTDAERVQAVQAYFLQNYRYSLKARIGPGDRTSDFLLNKRDAHCEFFASGGVILLRYLGIPARYVIGYMAHEADGRNALVVRGRDAHAWIECWIDNKWVVADFTPGGGQPDERAGPLPTGLKISEFFAKFSAAARALLQELRNLPLRFWLCVFGVLLLILIWRVRSPRRIKTQSEVFTYASRDAELAHLASRFEKWLYQRGMPCPPESTWLRHLQRFKIGEALPFARLYESARFGLQDDTLPQLRNLLSDLEQQKPKS
ncbi:MAG TPA: transglutaminase domain-containing protein [Abditibacteriaceae bacterium]